MINVQSSMQSNLVHLLLKVFIMDALLFSKILLVLFYQKGFKSLMFPKALLTVLQLSMSKEFLIIVSITGKHFILSNGLGITLLPTLGSQLNPLLILLMSEPIMRLLF